MKTKSKSKKSKKRKTPQDNVFRSIVFTKANTDRLLKLPANVRSNVMALYYFYRYVAVWQKTNCIWCTNRFVSEGLGWSEDKVGYVRKTLIGTGLIEVVEQKRSKKKNSYGQFGKSFVKVKYHPCATTVGNAELEEKIAFLRDKIKRLKHKRPSPKNKDTAFAGKKGRTRILPYPGRNGTNAYSNDKLNAYRNNIVAKNGDRVCSSSFNGKHQINKFDRVCAKKLYEALKAKKKIFRKVNLNKWIFQFKKLRVDEEEKKDRIKKVLLWYIRHIGEEWIPEAFSAMSFREKFENIEAAMERSNKGNGEFKDFDVKTTKHKDGTFTSEIDYES